MLSTEKKTKIVRCSNQAFKHLLQKDFKTVVRFRSSCHRRLAEIDKQMGSTMTEIAEKILEVLHFF